MEDDIPCIFKTVTEELGCPESSARNLTSDAFGMVDNVFGQGSINFHNHHMKKDVVVAELKNLEYYEEVRGTVRQNMGA